jgi:hypothetical protein
MAYGVAREIFSQIHSVTKMQILRLNLFAIAAQRNDSRVLASGLRYSQGNVRDQVQQDNAYLENRHPRVVKHIKLVH